MPDYDYIILGSGAAGLSLVMRMVDLEYFNDKKILLIDRDTKTKNDKTWCFWENQKGFFEDIVFSKWDHLWFHGATSTIELDIAPYQYKMIRSIDFYEHCFQRIKQCPNIDIVTGEVRSVVSDHNGIIIHLGDQSLNFAPAIVFNSLYRPSDISHATLKLLQHFKGWLIETPAPYFNASQAVLMDFTVHQQYGTSFVYLLPVSENKALVEYTLFTSHTLESGQYDEELRNYISLFLKLDDFSIREEEFGIIPMTNAKFHFYENGMYNIGTAGGQTKASTGYTFQFIQKQSSLIADCLSNNRPLSSISSPSKRFHFYDSVLLELLAGNRLSGQEIFTRLFERNKASRVFQFLDNETSPLQELQLISSLQTMPFLRAAIRLNFQVH